jgi:phenylpyruvate tautomerase PptA (4-oxalocrotonate tautomerase family)
MSTPVLDEKAVPMPTIKVNVPPDHTPEEEAALVAAVARAYEESHGTGEVTIEVSRPEEVDYKAVSERTHQSSRWTS